ncbi:IS1096 element passenger TnpR family protein [Cyclobacterium roseum]|uniref:IS1096 element passenger TnpR family protein n=1 Tax=Cyclobacterium roseum TaxID=2666137 RepID=UPI001391E648
MFKLKKHVKGISKPLVWRRLFFPNHYTFSRFHVVIPAAFGWEDYRLYQFSPIPNPKSVLRTRNEKRKK